ncbi:protein phosphatase 1 regulatory subunit 3B [Latimeria chalumnae]|nr:PREDICTED: protein phosphatase 1 regulatory subunit 3B [Latimeria chalumnae]|eukprot:XP_006009949.1 PREDICTED: protein phosphatase 1 regulatory subunit 3B [Latimeria chalumnae]
MPVEIAMQTYLSSLPLLRGSFAYKGASSLSKPLRPCINLNSNPKLNEQDAPTQPTQTKVGKHVSFADHKGLSLTMVKVFSEFDDLINIPLNITNLIDSMTMLTTSEKDKFVLDFAQPSSDYLDFRNRLQNECVCLENCMLKDKAIMGTVKVKNFAFEKSVKVRMTFDTWKNFSDYECQYVKDNYAGSDRDTFSFKIYFPEKISLHERIEFAVHYESGGKSFWDSNMGQNYRIIRCELKSAQEFQNTQSQNQLDFGIAFDQYGSPRCSYGIFPEWPSYSGYENMRPYY